MNIVKVMSLGKQQVIALRSKIGKQEWDLVRGFSNKSLSPIAGRGILFSGLTNK